MPYDFKKFIFSVSLCAMLAVNPVLATAPTNDEDLGTTHDVYVESTLNQATNGIAGVSYVNRMVNAAGNAADAAEAHAAAAGAHALSAAQSADEAHKVLADKVNIDQGENKKNLAMVTDDKGTVYAGYVAPGMIADGGKIDDVKTSPYSGFVLWSDRDGNVSWKTVDNEVLASGAVTASRIADGAVGADKLSAGIPDDFSSTGFLAYSGIDGDDKGGMIWRQVWADDIADSAVTLDKIAAEKYEQPQSTAGTDGVLLTWSMSGDTNQLQWRKIRAGDIGDGAVTIEKTEGVVGMVPVGSADATTYGQFWIE